MRGKIQKFLVQWYEKDDRIKQSFSSFNINVIYLNILFWTINITYNAKKYFESFCPQNDLLHAQHFCRCRSCREFQKLNYLRSFDLAPSDCFLFPKLKSDLRRNKFISDEESISDYW